MKMALGTVVLAGTLATFAAPAGSQECCDHGKAKPWKAYNTGIRWEAALSRDRFVPKDRDPAALLRTLQASPDAALEERIRIAGPPLPGPKEAWKEGLEPALRKARQEGKLVLFFQLVGDLDLEGC